MASNKIPEAFVSRSIFKKPVHCVDGKTIIFTHKITIGKLQGEISFKRIKNKK